MRQGAVHGSAREKKGGTIFMGMKRRTRSPDHRVVPHPDDGYTVARRAPGTACWVYAERSDSKRALHLLLLRQRAARLAGRLFRRTRP